MKKISEQGKRDLYVMLLSFIVTITTIVAGLCVLTLISRLTSNDTVVWIFQWTIGILGFLYTVMIVIKLVLIIREERLG